MVTYTIRIDEDQRKALLELLQATDIGGFNGSPVHPLAYWQGMLKQLPKDETETPGVLHGFTL